MVNNNVSNIIYVSCNLKKLVQGLITFQNNSYEVKKDCSVDIFPFSINISNKNI